MARHVREEIFSVTRCPASVGAGSSMLLARIATGIAKPNGQMWLGGDVASQVLETLPVAKLPGVGWKRAKALEQRAFPIRTCGDLRIRMTLSVLQSLFGNRVGKLVWQQAAGKDSQPVQVLKGQASISAEMNYGMRYTHSEQPLEFIRELANGLARRLSDKGIRSGNITLKVMRAKKGVSNPVKFQGHGICDTFSRSTSLSRPTDDPFTIAGAVISLLDALSCPPSEIRGIGIKLSSFFQSSSGMHVFQTSRNVEEWECRAEGAMRSWLNTKQLLDDDKKPHIPQLPQQQKAADNWKSTGVCITRSQVCKYHHGPRNSFFYFIVYILAACFNAFIDVASAYTTITVTCIKSPSLLRWTQRFYRSYLQVYVKSWKLIWLYLNLDSVEG